MAEPESPTFAIREPRPDEHERVQRFMRVAWGSTTIVSRGRTHDASQLPTLVAIDDDALAGVVTYRIDDDECEIVTIDALQPGRGIGTALLETVARAAARAGCRRLWLITSNDNLDALRFYQRRGLHLVAVHPGAVDAAREIKPEIPVTGLHGIPLRDEVELELPLDGERYRSAA